MALDQRHGIVLEIRALTGIQVRFPEYWWDKLNTYRPYVCGFACQRCKYTTSVDIQKRARKS